MKWNNRYVFILLIILRIEHLDGKPIMHGNLGAERVELLRKNHLYDEMITLI